MIRKLTSQDFNVCMDLLKKRAAENLFIIGDIENFGFDTDFQEVWGEFSKEKLIAILLRYEQNVIVYANGPFNTGAFAEMVDQLPVRFLSGLEPIVELMKKKMKRKTNSSKRMYYAKCTNLAECKVIDEALHYSTVDDYEKVHHFLMNVPEFNIIPSQLESRRRTLQTRTGRTIYIEKDGKVVSTASTTAENSLSAMIISVATADNYKGHGYGTKVVYELTRQIIEEGKTTCLFYDNPAAGKIYERIGYVPIGFWRMEELIET